LFGAIFPSRNKGGVKMDNLKRIKDYAEGYFQSISETYVKAVTEKQPLSMELLEIGKKQSAKLEVIRDILRKIGEIEEESEGE